MLQAAKPKTARSKRAVEKKAPLLVENPKTTLFLRGEKCSQLVQLALADLNTLKLPNAIKFFKKNAIHPFEDASSLEFFAEKNDASLMVLGYTSKKRPHCMTFVRTFGFKVLDMLELYLEAETMRTLDQFKNSKVAVGMKPLLAFSGGVFEGPAQSAYTLAKNVFTDFFKGGDAGSVDVEGLQCLIHISAGEVVEGQPAPKIHLRVYRIVTKRSGQKVPRVEVDEIGPRFDFRVGRVQQPDDDMLKQAMKKPKGLEARTKKNIDMDMMGDKIGKVHLGKQDLSTLQTRKMKGLKRGRDEMDVDAGAGAVADEATAEVEAKRVK